MKILDIVEEEMREKGLENYIDLVDAPMGLALLSMTIDDLINYIPDDQFEEILEILEEDPRVQQQLRTLPNEISQAPYHFEEGYTEIPKWYWKLR
jgi:hypothetical protein